MRVLVVESDRVVAELLTVALGEDGHEVVAVAHRLAALDLLGAGPWDACLCDGLGPDAARADAAELAGLGVLQAAVPVVLCTAHAWAVKAGAAAFGVSAVLGKPFDLDELNGVLEAVRRPA